MKLTVDQQNKRKRAIEWYSKLPFEVKFYRVIPWLSSKGQNVTSRHPDNLTGFEIEELYTFHKSEGNV